MAFQQRHGQRRLSRPVRVLLIGRGRAVCAARQQHLDHLQPPVLGGGEERGAAVVRGMVDARAAGQKRRRGSMAAFLGRAEERSGAVGGA